MVDDFPPCPPRSSCPPARRTSARRSAIRRSRERRSFVRRLLISYYAYSNVTGGHNFSPLLHYPVNDRSGIAIEGGKIPTPGGMPSD
jgi:hypothetical protein